MTFYPRGEKSAQAGKGDLVWIPSGICYHVEVEGGTDCDAYSPIRNGVEAMKNEWNQNRNIAYYAALCGISPTYFYRCFRRWAGKSPVEYRNMIRLSNAETMLRYTDMKINEISETVGFEDPFYFCRIFSAHFGISPTQYRKKQNRE